jgi:hypothetical protein
MRDKLAKLYPGHVRVQARIERYGSRRTRGAHKLTVLLVDVVAGGTPVTDHIWITDAIPFQAIAARPGDRVRFEGKIRRYMRGGRRNRDGEHVPLGIEYGLTQPRDVRLETKR